MNTDHLIVILLLCFNSNSVQFVPEYRTSFFIVFLQPAGTTNYQISFDYVFSRIPQILIYQSHLDIDGGIISYSTKILSSERTQFTLAVSSTKLITTLHISWIALLDDNIYVQQGLIQQSISAQTIYVNVPLTNPQNYIPQAAIFLDGINQVQTITTSTNDFQYSVDINTVSSNSIELKVYVAIGYAITSLDYSIIYGSAQYLSIGKEIISPLGNLRLFTVDSKTKVSLVGLSSISGNNRVRIDITNSLGQVNVQTWSDTTISQIAVNYFNYMPCPLYCTSCFAQAPACDSCISSTYRTGTDCTQCQNNMFLIPGQMNCQQCPRYCNICDNYTSLCLACSSQSLRLNPPNCMDCPNNTYINGDSCTQCDSSCQTCASDKCLTCLSQQYINTYGKCSNCPQHCLTCDINTCFTCAGNCQQCDLTRCIKCASDNYYVSGNECILCPENCTKCDGLQCLSCIGILIPINNQCYCQLPCVTCDSSQCLTCMPSDYRIYNLTCQYCPQDCITCDEQGYCYKDPQNCQLGNLIDGHVQCTQCQSNYYLQNNNCISIFKCSPQCLECVNEPYNCTICRFKEISSGECLLCESVDGFYSNYENNTCYTICGDGITSGNEQCDDGNSYLLDGCSNCEVDPGYYCIGMVCDLIMYPVPSIHQNLELDSVYNPVKQFSLSYNQAILQKTLDIQIYISNFTEFSYNLNYLNNSLFNIQINLSDQLIGAQIELIYKNKSEVLSNLGFQQQINMLSESITDYVVLQTSDKQISDSTNSLMNYLLIILVVLICISVLFGGLELYWNLLDLLQILSYLKYINTVKPYYLFTFFNLFNVVQMQNVPFSHTLDTLSYTQEIVSAKDFGTVPPLMQDDGYTSSTIINGMPLLNVLFISFGVYSFAKLLMYLDMPIQFFDLRILENHPKIIRFLNRIRQYLLKSCNQIIKQWIWSGLIRIFISSAYYICFIICLGIYGIQLQSSNLIIRIDSYLTILLAITYLFLTLLLSVLSGLKIRALSRYAALWEGLKQNQLLAKQHNIIMLIKKFLFMVSLVLLQHEPLLQILNIIFLQVSHLLYLIMIDPVIDYKEKIKQIICELFTLISELQLALLVVDDYGTLFEYENRRILGWICIFSIVIIIVSQLIIDTWQQTSYYYKCYPQFRKIFEADKNTHNASE